MLMQPTQPVHHQMNNYQNPNKQHDYNLDHNLDLITGFLMNGPGGGKPPHPQHNQMLQLDQQN